MQKKLFFRMPMTSLLGIRAKKRVVLLSKCSKTYGDMIKIPYVGEKGKRIDSLSGEHFCDLAFVNDANDFLAVGCIVGHRTSEKVSDEGVHLFSGENLPNHDSS